MLKPGVDRKLCSRVKGEQDIIMPTVQPEPRQTTLSTEPNLLRVIRLIARVTLLVVTALS
jgi:hypothetical protein